jgi:hypothetical protein
MKKAVVNDTVDAVLTLSRQAMLGREIVRLDVALRLPAGTKID